MFTQEDCDAPLFLETKKDITGEVTEYHEITSNYNSPIRGYRPYLLGTGYDDQLTFSVVLCVALSPYPARGQGDGAGGGSP